MTNNDYERHSGAKAHHNYVPQHVAIIMDGNGRWATGKNLGRRHGHKKGKEIVRDVAKACIERKIKTLTLFAFGKENWKRPASEVRHLLRLFFVVLKREISALDKEGICLKIHGQVDQLPVALQDVINAAEKITESNTTLHLNLMLNYSGRWDIEQAVAKAQQNHPQAVDAFFSQYLCLHAFSEPELMIRTAGVQRISNFILWDLAYTELYFTQCFWPDFNDKELDLAIEFYQSQERRFGLISDQVGQQHA